MTTNGHCNHQPIKIVTFDSENGDVLHKKVEEIKNDELDLAKEIAQKLIVSLKPHGNAAGLAAPQIGISKAVFIYSYDRDPKHIEVVINPTLTPIEDDIVEGWEACFSAILGDNITIAHVPRYEEIDVTYTNIEGKKVSKRLNGFSAKVFQHEYDHLQGILCICHPKATQKHFPDKQAFEAFCSDVRKEDSTRYENR